MAPLHPLQVERPDLAYSTDMVAAAGGGVVDMARRVTRAAETGWRRRTRMGFRAMRRQEKGTASIYEAGSTGFMVVAGEGWGRWLGFCAVDAGGRPARESIPWCGGVVVAGGSGAIDSVNPAGRKRGWAASRVSALVLGVCGGCAAGANLAAAGHGPRAQGLHRAAAVCLRGCSSPLRERSHTSQPQARRSAARAHGSRHGWPGKRQAFFFFLTKRGTPHLGSILALFRCEIFFGFRYRSTFVCLWQILSNHR